MTVINAEGLKGTEEVGRRIAGALEGTEAIAFFGGLGMGKTTLTRSIAEALGCKVADLVG